MEKNNKYCEILPDSRLEGFIKYYWNYNHYNEDYEFTILPDACFDLVIDYEYGILHNIFLTGIWTKPQKIIITKGTTLFAVRFKLIAAEYLFNYNIKKLIDDMIILENDFWNINNFNTESFNSFTENITDYICSILSKNKNIDHNKLMMFEYIYNNKTTLVSDIANKISWSPRKINRYFNKYFGLPLKKLLIMVRCSESYKSITNGDLYKSTQHSDQAHYIKEIKKYTYNTPRQLFKNDNDRFIQFIPLKIK